LLYLEEDGFKEKEIEREFIIEPAQLLKTPRLRAEG
jgi:hypothetical protein